MTLTQAAVYTKKFILIGSAATVVLLSGWISFQFWYTRFYLPNKRPDIPRPDLKFGTLPKPAFPTTLGDSTSYSYSIDNETGSLPADILPVARVYFIPQLGTTLLASNRARDLAEKLGFTQGPELVSPTLYRFKDPTGGVMDIDLNSGNFRFTRNSQPTDEVAFLDSDKLVDEFKGYLSDKNLLKPILVKGRARVTFDRGSKKDSQNALISLWPENIDNMPVVSPGFNVGLIRANHIKSRKANEMYTELSYVFWDPDKTNFSVYPIKTADEAFAELQQGQGVVVIKPNGDKASITKIYLAYYEPQDYQPYLQPIFVFEGESFAAFVPAIQADYLEK